MSVSTSDYDFNKEEDVKLFLENLGIEYRFGCYSEKQAESCHLLGDYLEAIKKDFSKASKVYKANCEDSSHYRSCFKFANSKFLGRGTTKSLKDALEYYDKGCSSQSPDSCLNGGLMCVGNAKAIEGVPKDYKKGMDLLDRACGYNHAFSCHYLAGMHIAGVPDYLPKNMDAAFKYSTKACELGNMYACSNVSQMYRNGEGTTKDEKKEQEFKDKAYALQTEQTHGVDVKLNQ